MKSDSRRRGKTRTIKADYLARVEGESAMYVDIEGDRVTRVALSIFEPPRFFEAFLRGRSMGEVPDITARICGICPIAYMMSSCHAIEAACGVEVQGALRDLRRLLYCGEWIESHVLHIAMLHAPDFLGYASGFDMAKDHPELVQRSLRLKRAGNAILTRLGGREIHPINVRVGGFYRAPAPSELSDLAEELRWAREAALDLVRWTAELDFPDFERDYELVALAHPEEYPMNEGRVTSDKGLSIEARDFEDHVEEIHVKRSSALHGVLRERGAYFVGPMARYGLNFERLSPLAREAARGAGLGPVCKNPFKSIVVRAVEVLYACEEALRILEGYERPDQPAAPVPPRAAVGHGCTEAPRGLLYHRYEIDAEGIVRDANIIPPTSQNQKTIEEDLAELVSAHVDLPDDELTWRCEQTIRNYDPCISCSAHFLDLHIERR